MFSIIIVCHSPLAQAFNSTIQHVFGTKSECFTIDVSPEQSFEEFKLQFSAIMSSSLIKSQTLVLLDVYGATPANFAVQFLNSPVKKTQSKVCGIAGFNLPLLLKAYSMRDKDLAASINNLMQSSEKRIQLLDDFGQPLDY